MHPTEKQTLRQQRLLVAFTAIAASIAGIRNDFAYDDILVILHDDRIFNVGRWLEFLTTPYWAPPHLPDLYRPVASLSLALQYVIGAGGPLVFRLVSVMLYALAALLVFALASRVMSRGAALAAGVLFAAHPVHVEAVVQGVNQGELLVAIFSLVAVCRYVDKRRDGSLDVRDWCVLAALYGLAILTKENGFVLPGLLVAAELFLVHDKPLAERVSALWRGYAMLGAVAVALVAVRTLVLAGRVVGAFTAEALVGASFGGRMLTMLQVVPKWFRLLLWPAHLQIDYSPNEIVASTGMGPHEWLGLALIVAIVVAIVVARRRAPGVSFGLFWCAVALFPVSNIVPTSIVLAERTLFLPSVGMVIAVCCAAALLAQESTRHPKTTLRARAAACAVLALLGVGRSAARHRDWRNAAHIWIVSAHDAPRSLRVQRARAAAAADLTKEFDQFLPGAPEPWRVHYQLGILLRTMEEDSAATSQLRLSLEQQAHQPDAARELAETLVEEGHYADAKVVVRDQIAAGDSSDAFVTIAHTADSAQTAAAPPGSVSLHLH
ncbi:MAG TPA: glycosyltransferase family 39 protein [Gemmatimonadaceae bacterium]